MSEAHDDDQAAVWFTRMNSDEPATARDEADFRAWLQDDANARAYRQCQAAWRSLGLDASAGPMLALRAEALRAETRPTRRRAMWGLGGGAVAASAAGLWVMAASSPARAVIATQVGQRLTAPLPDGSEVTLAPLTRLRLDYRPDRRAVTLQTGQAYFNVLPGDRRPFTVLAGERAMTADSSRFQVTLAGPAPEVVVETGVLTITPRRARQIILARLTPGERAVDQAGRLRVIATDTESLTAWRLGRLVVRDRPLTEVVAAFNHYSTDRLVLASPAAGQVRISGSFRYDGAQEFAIALERAFDLPVDRQPDGAWRIGGREGSATAR